MSTDIAIVGRGSVGGGLGRLWTAAGHSVRMSGRDGGDATGAEVVVVAVPGAVIADALGRVDGLAGQIAIDASVIFTERTGGFPSLAAEVKSIVGGPVAKSFSFVYASLYDEIAAQRVRPSSLWAGDDEAAEITERLIADAGYEPIRVGGLDRARALEELSWVNAAVAESLGAERGVFARWARPGEL